MNVSIIGVGNMGGGIAANLLARGWQVQVRDIDPAREQACLALGARVCANAAEAAAAAKVLIVCVVTAAQARSVLFGVLGAAPAMGSGHTVMLCPTIAPDDTEAIAAALGKSGVDVIDAPMSGGPVRAGDGSMSLMVACAEGVYRRNAEIIQAMSSKVFRVGQRIGDGARTKLVNNLLAGINLVGAAEALALAARMGLNLDTMQSVIEQSSGQSWIGTDRMRRALTGDYAPRAHMTLLQKDTGLALAAAQALAYPTPLGAQAHCAFDRACANGLADLDDAAVFQLLCRSDNGS